MSRILKFRAWDKVYEEYTTDNVLLAPDGRVISRHGFDSCDSFLTVNDVVIEFDTGLKDRNGKEIYEGDIVRTTDNVTVKGLIFPIGVVEFKQRAFWICNVPSERPDFAHNETLLQYWETDLEVIGNIHENPELLGGKK